METRLEKDVRFLKAYAVVATLLCAVFVCTAFTLRSREQRFEEITTNRITFVDAEGKERAKIGAQSGKGSTAGLLFYNEDQTEAGGLIYNGKRDQDGKIEAASLLTMDQFKSDEVVRLVSDQLGDQKRQGLLINDRPDMRGVVKEDRVGSPPAVRDARGGRA
jgi:hypothetical protein